MKKAVALTLCGAAVISASGCKNTTANALTIDGTDIRAGVYIYYQMDALNRAGQVLKEEQPDVDIYAEDFDITKSTIEGMDAVEWIKKETIDLCRYHVAVNNKFDEYGLTLSDEAKTEINEYVNGLWEDENIYAQYIYGVDIVGDYYESVGIGQQSYKEATTVGYKYDAIFDYLYGEGGTMAVPAEDIDKAAVENYALVKSFTIDPRINTAQEYLDMLNGGSTFEEVEQAYNKDDALADIEADMAEAEENGEEYTGTLPEDLEVALSDENALKKVVKKGSTSPSESYVNDVFAMADGESKIITVSQTSAGSDGTPSVSVTYYLVQRLSLADDAEMMEEYRENALHDLKGEELENSLNETGAGYTVTENAKAVKLYSIDKING